MDIIMFVNCVSAVRKHVRCTQWGWDEADNSPGLCFCTLPFLEILQVLLMQMPNALGTVKNLLSNPSSFVLIVLRHNRIEASYILMV
jgi:hypothetical protein